MSEVKAVEDCHAVLAKETKEESFSESHDVNRKISSTAADFDSIVNPKLKPKPKPKPRLRPEGLEDCDVLTEETQEESLSGSHDMNRQFSQYNYFCGGGIRPSEFVSSRNKSCQRGLRLKKEEFVIIKVRTAQGSSGGEEAENIPKEEAVCRFCFNILQEADNMLKTKCNCKFTLIHEACANEWTSQMNGNIKCNVCEQDIQMIPVTLCKHMDTNEGELNGRGTRKSKWWNLKNGTTAGEGASEMC